MMKKTVCLLLAMGLFAAPVYAGETETDSTAATESEEPVLLYGDVESEIKDGVFTIRIQALDTDDKNFYWESYKGDKGDASCTECLTETDMEDGLAYAGSFRGIEDGEDTIRIVHTNGFYTDGYLDFTVVVKDGKITENIGGAQGYGVSGEDLASVIGGTWQEEDGPLFMEISVSDDNGLDFVISGAGGKDGTTVYYTMTAYYDSVKESLIYKNGTEHIAVITDGSETEAENAAQTETEAEEGTGTGIFGFASTQDGEPAICWLDNSFGYEGNSTFVQAR